MPRLPIFAFFASLLCVAAPATANAQTTRFEARGVLQPDREATISAEIAGRVVELKWGAGDRLLVLESPELAFQLRSSAFEIDALRLQILRLSGGAASLQEIGVLQEKLGERLAVRDALERQQERMTLVAPFDGVLRDIAPDLHVGRWIAADMGLARLVADDPVTRAVPLRLREIDPTGVRNLDRLALASTPGGPTAVRADERQRLVPVQPTFRVVLTPDEAVAPAHTQRGTVHIDAVAESRAARAWRQALGVFVKESGF